MKSPTVIPLISFALLLCGCATKQPFFLPGESPDELVSTIAKESGRPGQCCGAASARWPLVRECVLVTGASVACG
jgi:hypothetical protein